MSVWDAWEPGTPCSLALGTTLLSPLGSGETAWQPGCNKVVPEVAEGRPCGEQGCTST